MRIDSLGNHTEYIEEIARWFHSAWGYNNEDCKTIERAELYLRSSLDSKELPATFICIDQNQPVGTITLKFREMDIRPEYPYWIGFLYVKPSHRGRGIARSLIDYTLKAAGELGMKELYLYNRNLEELYKKLGWNTLERVDYHGGPVTVMKKDTLYS